MTEPETPPAPLAPPTPPGLPPGDLGKKINRGLAWASLASSIVGVLEFVSLIVCLKFWISKPEFGIWGLVGPIFIAFELGAELGVTAAIIQRDDHTERKLSTLFWINVLASLGLYGVVAALAPLLAWAYGIEILAPLMWVFGLNMLVRTVYQIPYALLTRELRYGELSAIRVAANLSEVGCRIGFAAAGYGVWAFVIGVMARTLVATIGAQLRRPWWPKFVWAPREAAEYVGFGLRSSGHKIIFHLYTNVDYMVVTAFFGPAANGVYKAAYDLVLEPVRYLSNIIVNIAFTTFARLKGNSVAVVDQFAAFTRQNLVVVCALLALITVAAGDMLVVFIKPEYAHGALAARILAFVGLLRSLSYLAPSLLDGLGHPERTLRYQIIAAILLPSLFVLSAFVFGDRYGFLSVAIAWALGYPIAFAVLAWMTLDELQISAWAFVRRIAGIPACFAVAGVAAAAVRWATLAWSPHWRLAATTAALALTAALLLALFQGISPRSITRAVKDG